MLSPRRGPVYLEIFALLDLLCNVPQALEAVHVESDIQGWENYIEMLEDGILKAYVVSENAKRLSLSLHTVSCFYLVHCPQLAQVRA